MSPFIRRSSVRHHDRLLARSVLFLLLAVYTATFSGLSDNPDGEIAFQTTSALARDGGFALGGTPEADRIVAYTRSLPVGATPVRPGSGARADNDYAWFGVGYTAGALPLYFVGRLLDFVFADLSVKHDAVGFYGQSSSEYFAHALVGWRNSLLTALTGLLIVLVSRRMGIGRVLAWGAGLAYGLTTFAWPQARSTLSDVQATFFLFLAFHLILSMRERFDRLERPNLREPVWIGAAVGFAVLTRVSTLPAGLVLIALAEAILWGGRKRLAQSRHHAVLAEGVGKWRALACLLAPLGVCGLVFLATNGWRFGDPLDAGYAPALEGGGFFASSLAPGLAGLLVSPGRGLLWMAPLVLLLPLGILRSLELGERAWRLACGGVLLASIVPAAYMAGWHGAWTYGPRYLLPALPFLWIGSVLALDVQGERRVRIVCAGTLAVLGFVVQVAGVLVDHMTHQDLAVRAARIEWPNEAGVGAADMEAARFNQIQWDWRFAAPWAHWRILRHRAANHARFATLDEEFPVRQLFFLDDARRLSPSHERDRGFRHLFWVDAAQRLAVPAWVPFLLVSALLVLGAAAAQRGLSEHD
ncbi:MAG: hypothetical protein GY711_24710 [bacterium]|nr:hypothetical protein [bacterium]